jgi:hypothetical protein
MIDYDRPFKANAFAAYLCDNAEEAIKDAAQNNADHSRCLESVGVARCAVITAIMLRKVSKQPSMVDAGEIKVFDQASRYAFRLLELGDCVMFAELDARLQVASKLRDIMDHGGGYRGD